MRQILYFVLIISVYGYGLLFRFGSIINGWDNNYNDI
jgi:hypothetical protein